jgi:hypothetical protein
MKKIKQKYETSKAAKVGDNCICPSCGNEFEKMYYQQAFCKIKGKSKCKDKYWNTVTPEKRNNTSRISPANLRYSAMQADIRESNRGKSNRKPAWEVFGVWHDDDWNEGCGGSGTSE